MPEAPAPERPKSEKPQFHIYAPDDDRIEGNGFIEAYFSGLILSAYRDPGFPTKLEQSEIYKFLCAHKNKAQTQALKDSYDAVLERIRKMDSSCVRELIRIFSRAEGSLDAVKKEIQTQVKVNEERISFQYDLQKINILKHEGKYRVVLASGFNAADAVRSFDGFKCLESFSPSEPQAGAVVTTGSVKSLTEFMNTKDWLKTYTPENPEKTASHETPKKAELDKDNKIQITHVAAEKDTPAEIVTLRVEKSDKEDTVKLSAEHSKDGKADLTKQYQRIADDLFLTAKQCAKTKDGKYRFDIDKVNHTNHWSMIVKSLYDAGFAEVFYQGKKQEKKAEAKDAEAQTTDEPKGPEKPKPPATLKAAASPDDEAQAAAAQAAAEKAVAQAQAEKVAAEQAAAKAQAEKAAAEKAAAEKVAEAEMRQAIAERAAEASRIEAEQARAKQEAAEDRSRLEITIARRRQAEAEQAAEQAKAEKAAAEQAAEAVRAEAARAEAARAEAEQARIEAGRAQAVAERAIAAAGQETARQIITEKVEAEAEAIQRKTALKHLCKSTVLTSGTVFLMFYAAYKASQLLPVQEQESHEGAYSLVPYVNAVDSMVCQPLTSLSRALLPFYQQAPIEFISSVSFLLATFLRDLQEVKLAIPRGLVFNPTAISAAGSLSVILDLEVPQETSIARVVKSSFSNVSNIIAPAISNSSLNTMMGLLWPIAYAIGAANPATAAAGLAIQYATTLFNGSNTNCARVEEITQNESLRK